MGNHVQGKNIIVYMNIDGDFFPVFCGTGMRFSTQQDEIETTNITSGSDASYEAGMARHLLEISGVTTSDNTNGRVAITYLQTQSVRRQSHDWKITMTDNDGGVINYTFSGFIRDTDFDKSIPGYSKSNAVIRVSGPVTIDAIAPPPTGEFTIHADYWLAGAGNNYISGASTGNTDGTNYTLASDDVVLAVEVEDMTMYETTGTPTSGEPEYKFNTSPVRVEFPAAMVFDGGERVFVMFKRPV